MKLMEESCKSKEGADRQQQRQPVKKGPAQEGLLFQL